MANKNDDFLKRLLATFRVEADEHLKAMSAGLIELEKNPAADRYAEIVETVFREAHSLKGAARAVNLKEIESVCQPLESVLAALKNNQLAVSRHCSISSTRLSMPSAVCLRQAARVRRGHSRQSLRC